VKASDSRLLAFARQLHAIDDFDEMVRATSDEIRGSLGYNTAWVAIFDLAARKVRVLAVSGDQSEDIWARAPVFPIDDDRYLARILDSPEPQIVRDAQLDQEVNREVVSALGNRTIINVPMRLVDQPFGALGTGTFGDEGVRLPTEAELDHLLGIAGQLVAASARLVLARQRQQAARDKEEMNRRLAERQRLESLGLLAGGVAHDFNNLLTVMMATTSMLMASEEDARRADDLRTVLDAAERAAELTRRLLALGRRQALQLTSVEMNDLISRTMDMVRRVVPASMAIDIVPGHKLPEVAADRHQLEQVLVNLCLNARDAMPEKGRLTIETEHVLINGEFVRDHPWAKPGRYVLITVTDTGTGMTREVLDRVFEPFFTTKAEGKGTGLGLAVCRGIVEQHGGLIHAYSEPEVGTSFKIYMPVGVRAAAHVGTKIAGAAPRGVERILVADDESHVRRVIERVLQSAGYQVQTVTDGATAVARVAAEPFDLVILDAVMPVMGGREAFERLRAMHPKLPILFASGYGAEELTARFLADIDAPLISKPFDPDALLRAVRAALES
jgi:signal transduction histidine kinase